MKAIRLTKKFVMLTIKFGVGIFPNSLKSWFRKSPYLTSLYSRNLQRSGLFYGFPSRKKLDQLYTKNRIQQRAALVNCRSVKPVDFAVIVIVPQGMVSKLGETLISLTKLEDTQLVVYVMCCQNDLLKCRDIVSQDRVKSVESKLIIGLAEVSSTSCFIVYAGDVVHPLCAHAIAHYQRPQDEFIYVDTDQLEKGLRVSPSFYSDWNPELQLSSAYIRTGCWLCDVKLLEQQGFVNCNEGIASFFARMAVEQSQAISHIPLVLVHQTVSSAFSMHSYSVGLATYLSGKANVVLDRTHDIVSVNWSTAAAPLVSLIIPTKNGKKLVKDCIESILAKTNYMNFEILLVDNNSDESDSLEYFAQLNKHPQITLLKYPHPFNYSAINNFAVKHARGEVVALVNNDIEVITPEWLTYMVGHVMREDMGCVGAKLLYGDGRIQHAGVVMGYGGGAGHAHKYFPRYHSGYLNRLAATGNFSAVTAACLLVKKNDYLAVGGLNEKDLTIAFNDVDFCLKVLKLGRRNLYCAEAELYHHESVSRGFEDTLEKQQRFEAELNYLKTNWASFIEHDPAYNPNLTLRRENFSIRED
ncbi:MAG: GT2 family glycosyltransferase [Paraglaciecola sp.]|jgi:GT2 family glycosyltransferase